MWGRITDSEQLESVHSATLSYHVTFCQSNIIAIYGMNNWSTEKVKTQVAYLLEDNHFLYKEDTARRGGTGLRVKRHQFRAKELVKVIYRVYFHRKGNRKAMALFDRINGAFVCFVGAVMWFSLKACITGESPGPTEFRYESACGMYIKYDSWKEAN